MAFLNIAVSQRRRTLVVCRLYAYKCFSREQTNQLRENMWIERQQVKLYMHVFNSTCINVNRFYEETLAHILTHARMNEMMRNGMRANTKLAKKTTTQVHVRRKIIGNHDWNALELFLLEKQIYLYFYIYLKRKSTAKFNTKITEINSCQSAKPNRNTRFYSI